MNPLLPFWAMLFTLADLPGHREPERRRYYSTSNLSREQREKLNERASRRVKKKKRKLKMAEASRRRNRAA